MWSVVVVMRCKTLKATADRLRKLLDYYAGLAEDRERPGRLSRGPVEVLLESSTGADKIRHVLKQLLSHDTEDRTVDP